MDKFLTLIFCAYKLIPCMHAHSTLEVKICLMNGDLINWVLLWQQK